MGHRKKGNRLETFCRETARSGITYAEAQKQETEKQMERIRAPRTERTDGIPVYMKVSTRNILKNLKEGGNGNEMAQGQTKDR